MCVKHLSDYQHAEYEVFLLYRSGDLFREICVESVEMCTVRTIHLLYKSSQRGHVHTYLYHCPEFAI